MAGRKPGYRHIEETRKKIQSSALIRRLQDNAMADKPFMEQSQVNSAKALLNKVLPDLKAIDLQADVEHGISDDMASLLKEIDGLRRSK